MTLSEGTIKLRAVMQDIDRGIMSTEDILSQLDIIITELEMLDENRESIWKCDD